MDITAQNNHQCCHLTAVLDQESKTWIIKIPCAGLPELPPVHSCFGRFVPWPSAFSFKLFKSKAQVTEDIDSGYAEDIKGDGFKGRTNTHSVPFILWCILQNKLSIKPWTFLGLFGVWKKHAQGRFQSETWFYSLILRWNLLMVKSIFRIVSFTVQWPW